MAHLRRLVEIQLAAVVVALLTPGQALGAVPDDGAALLPAEWSVTEKPLRSPRALHAEASGETSASVQWDPADDLGEFVTYEVFRDGMPIARTRDHSATDAKLAVVSTHCYSVRAVDEAGRSSPPTSPVCITTPDLTPPGTPPDPAVALDSLTSATVRWAAAVDNVGVAGYEVLRNGRSIPTSGALRFAETGLRPAQTYCYAVRAFDGAGNRSTPSAAICVTPPDVTPPGPPAPLGTGGPRALTITWAASEDDVGVAGYEVMRGGEVVASTRDLSAVLGELPAGRHCASVRAFDAAGNRSAPVEACGVVPDTTPPTPPTAAVASAPGETSVVIRWEPSSDDVGVTGYETSRDGRVVGTAAQASGGDEDLRPGTAYCYAVRALDAAGNRSEPSPSTCVTTPDLTPPTAPALAAAEASSDRSLRVKWAPSADNVGVTGYEVLRDGAVVAQTGEPVGDVKGLSPGRSYCLEVRAFDAAGHRSASSEKACASTPDWSPPTTPSGLVASGTSANRVAVGWDPSEDDVGVTGYELWRGGVKVSVTAGTAWQEPGLAPATEYCYQLRAADAAGNLSGLSAPVCAQTTAVGTPAAPVELVAGPVSPRSVELRWKPSPDLGVVYSVYWDGERRIGSTRHVTYKVDGLQPGQRRCFQVSAVNEAGVSSPKTWPVCATTPVPPSASSR